MAAPYLLVLAHSRSGSNLLLDLLRALDGVASLGEYFHRDPKSVQVDFVTESLAGYDSPAARADAAIADPMATLSFRDSVSGVSLFLVKVLGQQLRDDRARRTLIDNAAGVIVLRRNPFAAWVSRALVDQSQSWVNTDTNRFDVTFDEAYFIDRARAYSTQIRDFLRVVGESGRPFVSMSYSDVLSFASPDALWTFLREQMPALPELHQKPTWTPRVARQDERLPIDRISNREDALASLDRLGLGYLADNTDTDDLDVVVAALAPKPERSGLGRLASAIKRRLG